MSASQKKYGLILKKPVEKAVKPIAAAFADEDEDVGNEIASSSRVSASTVRVEMQAKRDHEKAIAEDPTVFDYDAIYDELQAKKNEKIAEFKAADKERKSKYAEQILEAHKKRLLAQQSREERKQQKEREAEAGQFDDKEKFVTSAYRQQLVEMEKFRLQEAADNRLDELTAVDKQKSGMWKGGFYRTLLNDLARDGGLLKTEEKEIKQEIEKSGSAEKTTVASDEHTKKLSALRKNSQINETLLPLPSSKETKKSIYSSESSDEGPGTSSTDPVQLKPGLNILKPRLKKPTKAEQIRRRFTPSPENSANSSEEEKKRKKDRNRHSKRRSHDKAKGRRSDPRSGKSSRKRRGGSHEHRFLEKGNKRRKTPEEKVCDKKGKETLVEKIVKEKTKEERLQIIRRILAHRNGPEEIEKMRQRYLERKEKKSVTLPL